MDEREHAATRPVARRRWMAALEVLLVFMVFFVQGAGPAPETNEPHYLGKAKHYWNPGWIENDFFLNTPDAHHVFYWTFGWLTLLLPLPAVSWVGRLLGWGLLAFAWHRASTALVPRPLFSVLSAALFVTGIARFDLAGEWVVGGIEAKVFAYVLVLLAMEALIKGRWNRVWLFLGGAAAFHVLVGGWSVVAAGFAWLASGRAARPPLPSMLPALVGGFLLSLPGLLPALALTQGVEPEMVRQANQIYVYERLPHHLAPHTLSPAELASRLRRSGIWVLAFVLLALLARRRQRVRRMSAFVVGAMLLSLAGFAIGYATEAHPELGAKLLRYYWFRLHDFAVPMGVALLACAVVARWQSVRPRLAAAALLVLIAIPVWHLGDLVLQRHANPRAAADRKIENPADWRDASQWIAEHTPPDAVFLTPRSASTFKWYTERAEVVSHKDIPQDARGIVAWWQRLDDVYRHPLGTQRPFNKSLSHQGAAALQRAGEKYGAQYVLTRDIEPLALPLLYRNETYAVYRLP